MQPSPDFLFHCGSAVSWNKGSFLRFEEFIASISQVVEQLHTFIHTYLQTQILTGIAEISKMPCGHISQLFLHEIMDKFYSVVYLFDICITGTEYSSEPQSNSASRIQPSLTVRMSRNKIRIQISHCLDTDRCFQKPGRS
jgi:hypothetical protein